MEVVQPILVVEDDALIRMSLVECLVAGGYTVSDCGSGAAALAFIDESDDLHGLATDIKLGKGPSGWEVAHHARQKYPNIAVIYFTGDSTADWSSQGVPNSVALEKPFAAAQMLTAMATLMMGASS